MVGLTIAYLCLISLIQKEKKKPLCEYKVLLFTEVKHTHSA